MKLIIANWKCNPPTLKQAEQIFVSLRKGVKKNNFEIVICPSFVHLSAYKNKSSKIKLGAQNCFWENSPTGKGAFTGEVSPLILKDLGVKYIILGHSERRRLLKETSGMIADKVKAVLDSNLHPIVCLGESQEQKDKGETFQALKKELTEALEKAPKSKIERVVIAYEPIWAIGAKKSCSLKDASSAVLFFRKIISQNFSKKAGKNIRIIYGGSVNGGNAASYLAQPWIDGLLIGNASLNPKEFLKIINGQ